MQDCIYQYVSCKKKWSTRGKIWISRKHYVTISKGYRQYTVLSTGFDQGRPEQKKIKHKPHKEVTQG